MARDKLDSSAVCDLKLKLISDRQTDGRLYNLPNASEVAALIVGDEHTANNRDIIIEKQTGMLQRINELHPAYLPLQYPLLYPHGEDGYRPNILHKHHSHSHATKRNKVTMPWPEIQRQVAKSNLTAHDCPDVVSRVFKIKLNQLMHDLKSGNVFGPILACKYVSAPETCWKIFAFPMHERAPAVERLYFHLENQQSVYWKDSQEIGTVLAKSTIKESMFTAWMDSNKIYHHGRDLTYAEYVSKFVYDARKRCWKPRKQGNTIGRLIWVPPSSGELFYMRMMLSSAKGSQCYEDIRTVENVVYHTFREACFAKGIQLTDKEKMHLCLTEIENLLQANRKSLRDFPSMPYPLGYAAKTHQNNLIYNELAYDREILAAEFDKCYQSLTGKTFVWKTLSSAIRSTGGIVLTVASSGIASILLPGGSDLAELFHITKLIIWDEAPMCHRYSIEALDKSLQDIMHNNNTFGGKVNVFCGDFRQILPVVPRGNRSDIVYATLNSSYIWNHCQILKLTKNMRLQSNPTDHSNLDELKQFSEWLLDIGDGKLAEPNDGYGEITIPDEFLIKDFQDPIQAIVEATYSDLLHNYNNGDFLQKRVVLASTKDVVDKINDYVLSLIPGEEKEYCSVDSVDKSDELLSPAFGVLTAEFLNSLKTSGIPNHKLIIKVGTPIILLRNLDQADGLCNETRLIVTRLGSSVVEAEIIVGPNIGHRTYIPRMNLSPSDSPWPFKLIRRQFPFMVSFAMTINKSQGQSLAHVGLYLPTPVFSHGQLYVALSRVQSKKGLHILIHDNLGTPKNTTINVVYKEVFSNL
ncbi:ATP-dependent DNA helicase PIF1 [Glycine soja]